MLSQDEVDDLAYPPPSASPIEVMGDLMTIVTDPTPLPPAPPIPLDPQITPVGDPTPAPSGDPVNTPIGDPPKSLPQPMREAALRRDICIAALGLVRAPV